MRVLPTTVIGDGSELVTVLATCTVSPIPTPSWRIVIAPRAISSARTGARPAVMGGSTTSATPGTGWKDWAQ